MFSLCRSSYSIDVSYIDKLERANSLAEDYSSLLVHRQKRIDSTKLKSHLSSIAERFMRDYHVSVAKESSKDFVWPEEVWTKDLHDLQRLGSIQSLIEHRQSAFRHDRINGGRILQLFGQDPEYEKLVDLAENGVIIDLPDGFVPSTEPPPMGRLHNDLVNTFRAQAYKKWCKGKTIILPLHAVDPVLRATQNFCRVHWTPKPATEDSPGNKLGRILVDPSHGEPNSILNTPDEKAKSILRYGKCDDADIRSMATKWLQYCASKNYSLNECSLCKDDVAEAFPQLCFNKSSAPLMCAMIDEELYSIDLNGNFGHTSLPMAFNFVSQRHLQRVRSLVDGVIDKYVDDYMMFSHDSTIDHVQSTNQECLRALFGPASVEPSKIVPPCKAANIIGWYVNLTTGLVRPNNKGINKLLFVFFFIDETQPQPLKAFQLISSLTERYSLAIKGMRSLIDPITNMTRKWDARHPFSKRKADSSARFAIEM